MADGDNLTLGQNNSADVTTRLARGGAITRTALTVENGNGDGIWSQSSGNDSGVLADSDSGAGVFGRSASGWGILGICSPHALITPPRAAVAAIAGGAPGTVTPAVYARSERGYAVEASATGSAAVYAESSAPTQAAVYGVNQDNIGIVGQGRIAVSALGADEASGGVYATGSNYGVWGISFGGTGVEGRSEQGTGVRGVSVDSSGVVGQSAKGSRSPSILGYSSGFEPGVQGHSPDGPAVVGTTTYGSAASFVGPVYVWGSLFVIGATKSAVVPHPDGTLRQLYCVESPESWFEDFGTGELREGEANIPIDPDFAALVQADDYHVFLTPYDDCNGLYVSRKEPDGFQVREQRGGHSSLQFSYRLLSRRRDVDAPRLEPVTPPPRPEPPVMPTDEELARLHTPTPGELRRPAASEPGPPDLLDRDG